MKSKKCNLYFLPAGQGDCFVIQFQDESLSYHNILVDGGNRSILDFKKQKKQLLKIIDNGKKGRFDLVIVTHSDQDHILGILKLVGDNEIEQYVDKYWFNSEKTLAKFFKSDFSHTQKYPVNNIHKGIVKSSRQQDNDLYSALENTPKWDCKVITDQTTEHIGGLKLTVLSPSVEKLRSLNEYWPSQPLRKGAVQSSGEKKFDYDLSIQDLEQRLTHFEQDESRVNGASIAFLLEFHSLKWLFLSDSHPDIVVTNLKKLVDSNNNKIKIDVVKLSHHGSKKNTNNELLELIDCHNFVVSANANKTHYHPNKETLVRVLKHVGIDKTKLHFVIKNKDIAQIFSTEPKVRAFYPNSKEEGITFNYEC